MGSFRLLPGLITLLLAFAIAGCGAGGSGAGGDQLPLYGIPGGNGSGNELEILNPQVGNPPIETFRDNSSVQDSAATRWLKNCYYTLPPLDSATSVYQNASLQTWADMIFAGINANRAKEGRAPLKRNSHLDALAQAHARDMALRDFFDHLNPEQMTYYERMLAINPPRFSSIGETAAAGQESPEEVAYEWYNSEKHHKISMDPTYEYAGVGVYCDVTKPRMPMHIIMDFVQFKEDVEVYTGWINPGPAADAQ
jgi:uncharacterized protein YkwD